MGQKAFPQKKFTKFTNRKTAEICYNFGRNWPHQKANVAKPRQRSVWNVANKSFCSYVTVHAIFDDGNEDK